MKATYSLFLLIALTLLLSCKKERKANAANAVEKRSVEEIFKIYQDATSSFVMVGAHRADWHSGPENSLSAIQSCIDMGIEFVELDIQITLEGELILMHDGDLGRTSTGAGDINFRPLSYIKEQFLLTSTGDTTSERIPTLREALALCKGKILVVIDKWDYLIPEVKAVVQETGMTSQVAFIGFKDYAEAHMDFGNWMDSVLYIPAMHKSISGLSTYMDGFENNYATAAYAYWIDEEDSRVIPYISTAEDSGKRIWINSMDPKHCAGHTDEVSLTQGYDKGWGWILKKGGNIILTDYPYQLKTYLKSINRR